jgi:hypothetical protein
MNNWNDAWKVGDQVKVSWAYGSVHAGHTGVILAKDGRKALVAFAPVGDSEINVRSVMAAWLDQTALDHVVKSTKQLAYEKWNADLLAQELNDCGVN